ncbi:MAG: hypothetical protein HQL21_01070, partial [Candidatus Omnitrophica bacterium]|nr:hypothetical protein [Candidatus Omnitrophota bacterium]
QDEALGPGRRQTCPGHKKEFGNKKILRILDVGAGSPDFLTKLRPVLNAAGFDAEMVAVDSQWLDNEPSEEFARNNITTIASNLTQPESTKGLGRFDLVFLNAPDSFSLKTIVRFSEDLPNDEGMLISRFWTKELVDQRPSLLKGLAETKIPFIHMQQGFPDLPAGSDHFKHLTPPIVIKKASRSFSEDTWPTAWRIEQAIKQAPNDIPQEKTNPGRASELPIANETFSIIKNNSQTSMTSDLTRPEAAMAIDKNIADFEMKFIKIIEDAAKIIGKSFEAFTPQDWEQFSDTFIDSLDNRRWTISDTHKDIFVLAVRQILSQQHVEGMINAKVLSVRGLTTLLQRLHSTISILKPGDPRFYVLTNTADPNFILNKSIMAMGERQAILEMSGINQLTNPAAATEPFKTQAAHKEFLPLVTDVSSGNPQAISAITQQFDFNPLSLIDSTLQNLTEEERNGWWTPEVLRGIQQSFLEGMIIGLTAAGVAQRHNINPEKYIGRGIDYVVLKGTLNGKPVALKARMLHQKDLSEEQKQNKNIQDHLKKHDFFVDDVQAPIIVRLAQESALVIRVVEYIEGPSLAEHFLHTTSSHRDLAFDMRLAGQFLDMRTSLSAEGLQDLDLEGTPYNILISPSGRLKQIDYGLIGEQQSGHETETALALVRLMTGHVFDRLQINETTRSFLARSLARRYNMKNPQLATKIINAIFRLYSEMDLAKFTNIWNKDLTSQAERAMEKAPEARISPEAFRQKAEVAKARYADKANEDANKAERMEIAVRSVTHDGWQDLMTF